MVDQILVGWYGGQAVEAMAMGKIVVAFLNPSYLELVPFGQEIPIWQTNPWTFKQDLEKLLQIYPKIKKDWTQRSYSFVKKYHEARIIAESYLRIYRETL